MTNSSTRGTSLAREIQRIEIEAQLARAEAISDAVAALGRGIGNLFGALVRGVRRIPAAIAKQHEADRIISELSRMSNRDLADLGIARSDIAAIAAGTYARPEERHVPTAAPQLVVASDDAGKAPAMQDDQPHELDRAA